MNRFFFFFPFLPEVCHPNLDVMVGIHDHDPNKGYFKIIA